MNEKPEYVYLTNEEYSTLMQLPGNPFDPTDFDEHFIDGFVFAQYGEIDDDEWAFAEDNNIVIKAAAYNESNQIILGPLG